MNTRRTRATTRREESPDPARQGPVTRQTRSSSKRADLSDASPQSKSTHAQSGYPQRGTRRRRRRSLESVATNDFPKSSVEQPTPEHSVMEVPEPTSAEEVAVANTESQDDSYEERVAQLQDMLDFDLPKLARWCDKIYEALSSLTRPEPTVEERTRLSIARKFFKRARLSVAQDDVAYVDLASSDLPYREDPETHATVQKFTRAANLISLLLSLADLEGSTQNVSPFLQELDDKFRLFLDPDSLAEPEDHALAFRARYCRLLELVREEREIEPVILAAALFCDEPAAMTLETATQRLREGPFRILGSEGQDGNFTSSPEFKAHMSEVLELPLSDRAELEGYFDNGDIFPLDKLLRELREWAMGTYSRVTKVDENDRPTHEQVEGEVHDRVERKKSEGLFLSEGNESSGDSDSELSSEHEEYHQLKTLTKEPSFIQDPGVLAAVRQRESGGPKPSRTELQPKQKTAREKLTESQITDAIRQLDPAEILGDSGDDTNGTSIPPAPGAVQSLSRASSQELGATGKRTHSQEDDDYVDDNDDFEVNEQVISESRRRNHYERSDVSRPVPKRSRFSVDLGRNGGRPRSPENTPAGTNLTESDLATLSRAARANKLANKGRGQQVRERWSDVDTDHLLDLIADPSLNCSWSEMEKKGGFQTYRNQQAIRDKARNLKKGYLCADAVLPAGFDLVYLSKKEKSDVIASGRNPDRTEDDIDERGRVVHYRWRDVSG
ncbi:hypothetical protein F5Y03DRAFT_343971 [Xylaria venustula]|nr:hypothetical protein F5Y03DRAFT_343971 [Xylaria venustula]